jgi:hypothetical protein
LRNILPRLPVQFLLSRQPTEKRHRWVRRPSAAEAASDFGASTARLESRAHSKQNIRSNLYKQNLKPRPFQSKIRVEAQSKAPPFRSKIKVELLQAKSKAAPFQSKMNVGRLQAKSKAAIQRVEYFRGLPGIDNRERTVT